MEVLMGKQYILNGTALVAGIAATLWSRLFTGGTLEWVVFGIGAAVALAGVVGLKVASTARTEAGFSLLGLVGAWSAFAALVFSGTTLGWLAFADAIATIVVAGAALVAHELTTERVVHTLEVREQDTAAAEFRTAA
jgi:hypothetical protein